MQRLIVRLLIAGSLVVGGVSIVGTPAFAGTDSPGCVTRAEYKQAKKHMTRTKVHAIWDTAGKRQSHASGGGYQIEVRTYRVCGSPYSSVAASFDKDGRAPWRLSAKTAVWVG